MVLSVGRCISSSLHYPTISNLGTTSFCVNSNTLLELFHPVQERLAPCMLFVNVQSIFFPVTVLSKVPKKLHDVHGEKNCKISRSSASSLSVASPGDIYFLDFEILGSSFE